MDHVGLVLVLPMIIVGAAGFGLFATTAMLDRWLDRPFTTDMHRDAAATRSQQDLPDRRRRLRLELNHRRGRRENWDRTAKAGRNRSRAKVPNRT